MRLDGTYVTLRRAGEWDAALAAFATSDLTPSDLTPSGLGASRSSAAGPDAAASAASPAFALGERAEILVERFWWRLTGAAETAEAITALRPADPVLAGHLDAQLRYTRLLFDLDPQSEDAQRARDGFTAAAGDNRLAGWAAFWLGILTEKFGDSPADAAPLYEQARHLAVERGDTLLESYAIRHIGYNLLPDHRGLTHLRRSYHLRAALGARPQTAAAALTLADELPPGPEAAQLREAALLTARDLHLTWLLAALTPPHPAT